MVEAKMWSFAGDAEPTTVELDEAVFGHEVHVDLLHRAVRIHLLRQRQGTSATKTRGMVQGGGRKPWRQKGTGRARAGSRRSPLWVGGGTMFGPQPRSYDVKLTKKMRRGALRSALSDRARNDQLVVLDRMGFSEPKTSVAASLLRRIGIGRSALVVVAAEEMDEATQKSFRNLPGVKCVSSQGANVYDVLRHETLVLTQAALSEIGERT
jgi:large subunit ribosomal protein L4